MSQEIERKFLVKGDFKPYITKSEEIKQAYLCTLPGKTVRIRTKGNKAFITIKGKSSNDGLSRYEWEKEIPVNEAKELFLLCDSSMIDKTRHLIPHDKHVFELDIFYGVNDGLVIAEVELSSEDEVFTKPDWLGQEVTGDKKYYNASLIKNPYKNWK